MTTSIWPTSWSTKRLACLLVVLALAPATALAGKKDEAKAHIAKATQAHKDGRFAEALVELDAAYALDPQPDLLYAMGQIQAKLGNCSVATTYFKRFAATQKDPQVAKVVTQAIAACKPGAAPAASSPPADKPSQASPPPPPPSPTVDAEQPPPPPASPPAAPPAAPLVATPSPQPAARPEPAPEPAVTRQRSAWYKDKLGDGLVLGGVVATVVGLVEYGSARADLDAAEDRTQTTNLAGYQDLVDSAHGKRTASIVLVGAGGALITAGIVHYVLHDRTTETRGVGLAPAHGGGVVTYQGSF